MATLNDVVVELKNINSNTLEIALYSEPLFKLTESMHKLMETMYDMMKVQKYNNLETNDEKPSSGSGITPSSPDGKKGTENSGGKGIFGFGLGAKLGSALGGGILKGVAGIATLGAAISAFFGGLVLGDKLLGSDWANENLDFEHLKTAAKGFSSIIRELDGVDMLVLGGIMGLSAFGGWRSSAGLATMGAAISAFFAGLVLGEQTLDMNWSKKKLDFVYLQKAAKGFSGIVESLGTSIIPLGVIMASSAFAGLKGNSPWNAAAGLASMGAGISGFFAGLAIGNAILGGIAKIPGGDGLKHFESMAKSFGNIFTSLNGAIGIGAVSLISFAATKLNLKGKEYLTYMTAMTALGAGISGFFIGLSAPGDIASALGATGEGTLKMVENFSKIIGALDGPALLALGSMMGVSGVLSAIVGFSGGALAMPTALALGAFAVSMGLLGAGIGAFFAGLSTVGDLGTSNGAGAVSRTENFVKAVQSLNKLEASNLLKVGSLVALWPSDSFRKFVEALKPLEEIDESKYKGFDKVLDKLTDLSSLDLTQVVNDIAKLHKLNNLQVFDTGIGESEITRMAIEKSRQIHEQELSNQKPQQNAVVTSVNDNSKNVNTNQKNFFIQPGLKSIFDNTNRVGVPLN